MYVCMYVCMYIYIYIYIYINKTYGVNAKLIKIVDDLFKKIEFPQSAV